MLKIAFFFWGVKTCTSPPWRLSPGVTGEFVFASGAPKTGAAGPGVAISTFLTHSHTKGYPLGLKNVSWRHPHPILRSRAQGLAPNINISHLAAE